MNVRIDLPEELADALWVALKNARPATEPAPTPIPPAPPAPAPVPTARPQTELERIMAGVQWTPAQAGFPNGWPEYDPDQSSARHKDTDYIHTDSKGGGYYTLPGFAERSYKPMPNINDRANPRVVPGLYAVLMSVGLTPEFRTKAFNALAASPGNFNDTINANAQADPEWNGQVRHMLEGTPPATAELQAAKAVADSL